MARRLPLFATAARGTEALLGDELTELGAARVRLDRGGVRFLANLDEALRIALWSRIAMRLLWPLAEGEARGADGLYALAHQVPWEEHLGRDTTFAVEATLRDSEHRHSGFVALKSRTQWSTGSAPGSAAGPTSTPAIRISGSSGTWRERIFPSPWTWWERR